MVNTEIKAENEETMLQEIGTPICGEIMMANDLSLEVLIDDLILTHGSQTHSAGIIVGPEPTCDKPALEEIEARNVSTEEQVCAAGNQFWLRESKRTVQDSQSDTQAPTILDGNHFSW